MKIVKPLFLFVLLLCFKGVFGQSIVEKKMTVNAETISYLDRGSGKITLLFIHGSFTNKEYWNNQIAYFSPRYRVVAVDLAGHGNSTANRADWTIKSFGKDISGITEKLALKNVIIVAHSIGADIMLEAVSDNNASIIGLIAIDYFKNMGHGFGQNDIGQIVANMKNDFAKTNEAYVNQALVSSETDAAIKQKIVSSYKTMNPKVGIPMNEDFLNYSKREAELLKKNHLKLYVINVDYVPTNEEGLKQTTSNRYELVSLKGTSHFPMIEKPKEFNALLEKVILKIEQSSIKID